MAGPVVSPPDDPPTDRPETPAALPAVPGPRAGRILAFLFLVLAEYWLAPLFLGITNYAGTWSEIGVGLFVAFVAGLVGLVLWPLRRHLAAYPPRPRDRWAFHGLWAGALVVSLFATNSFQLGVPTSAPGYTPGLGVSTVYTPFGAWPSLTVYLPALHFYGTLVPEEIIAIGLLSVLGAAIVRLTALSRAARCAVDPVPAVPRSRLSRLASVAVWSPLGFVTGCASCTPIYLGLVGLVAPGVVAGGFSTGPLVPWIGFTGLVYLLSFAIALVLLRRVTTSAGVPPTPEVSG